ncbi:hypothetical protein A3SAC12_0028 [Lactobacillus phage 3-SAC12]|nr:hypothetical protein A3SAC12_0028 [Lactobacillus phage 3-SAC12]
MHDFLRQLNSILTVSGGIIAAWFTYHQAQKKSDREAWQSLYNEMKERAEKAEAQNEILKKEIDKLRSENNE